jgi:DNA repair protein RadC
MAIHDWPAAERPRERLLAQGPEALTDAELLAIFLRTGLPGQSAVDLARACLSRFSGLTGLMRAPLQEFVSVKGLGEAKYTQLQAVAEIARRALGEELRAGPVFHSSRAVSEYLRLWLRDRPYEVFGALFLDAQHRLIAAEELFRGTLTQTSVYPREVVKSALRHNAHALILTHNHPSGMAEPSRADELLTVTLRSALGLMDIRVLDHVIVAGQATFSFADGGLL